MAGILVYALHYEGQINKNSLGAVSEGARLAAELGTECHAIVVGEKAGLSDEVLAPLGAHGASKVFRVDGPEGLSQPVVDAMAKVIGDNGHEYALFAAACWLRDRRGPDRRLDAGRLHGVTAVRVEEASSSPSARPAESQSPTSTTAPGSG